MFLIIRHLSRNLYLSVVLVAVCFEIRLFRHKISKMSCANTQIWNAEEEEEQESSAYHKINIEPSYYQIQDEGILIALNAACLSWKIHRPIFGCWWHMKVTQLTPLTRGDVKLLKASRKPSKKGWCVGWNWGHVAGNFTHRPAVTMFGQQLFKGKMPSCIYTPS